MTEEKGTIIIIAIIATAILMTLSAYLLNLLTTEIKLSDSATKAEKAYYLAESGINEAIWKLENDDEWAEKFVDPNLNPNLEGEYWSKTFKRELTSGSYEVTIQNISLGEAKITAVAKVPFRDKMARREAEATVFKSLDSPTDNSAVFSGGDGSNIHISHSNLTINNGNMSSGHNLLVSGNSTISLFDNNETEKLEGKVLSAQNVNFDNADFKEYEAICSRNICSEKCDQCPPEESSIPAIDFDSEAESSFKSRAEKLERENQCNIVCNPKNKASYSCSNKCILSPKETEDLLWEVGEDGLLEINNRITYVNGGVELKGARSMRINGLLVADGTLDLGTRRKWIKNGVKHSGNSHLDVLNSEINKPAGLISKKKINFGSYLFTEEASIEGVVYASDQVNLISISYPLTITGGIMGRQLHLSSIHEGVEINFNNKIILYGLGYMENGEVQEPVFSPVIEIDHWEEVY